ncbi:helix-turn-helix domain containing protein [Ruminococcaceae bacterium OttesenSCG-928-D13]|nr:helix-turn-helix domain containing protein [Ruminococcaceae bacterium OttesenSCG-928-D13]
MGTVNKKKAAALQAVLESVTLKDAAVKAGISRTTLYRYMHDDEEFKAALADEMGGMLSTAKDALQKAMLPATGALYRMVAGEDTPDANKISACRAVLDYALKLTETEDVIKRLEHLEQSAGEPERGNYSAREHKESIKAIIGQPE